MLMFSVLPADHYTESERKRVLGQSGNRVFEKYYQSDFIGGLQHVVLLRPSQETLCREARKSRRDPLAPTDLGDEQLEAIRRNPRIVQLRKERLELRNEIRSLAGTIEAAQELYPELHLQHAKVIKRLHKERKALRKKAKEEMKEEYHDTMPTIEVDKQIDQLLDNPDADLSDLDDDDEDWNPPIPEYVFSERARIVEAFYGPEAETLEGDLALTRRIQVTKDMTALCGLWEPNRRGKSFNWNKEDDSDDESKQEDDSLLIPDTIKCPIDVCIICLGPCTRSGASIP
jgi:hypothetical protein